MSPSLTSELCPEPPSVCANAGVIPIKAAEITSVEAHEIALALLTFILTSLEDEPDTFE
jgi:hypothetical protein